MNIRGLMGQAGLHYMGLLAHVADMKVTDADGDTALDFAVKNGHREATVQSLNPSNLFAKNQ